MCAWVGGRGWALDDGNDLAMHGINATESLGLEQAERLLEPTKNFHISMLWPPDCALHNFNSHIYRA